MTCCTSAKPRRLWLVPCLDAGPTGAPAAAVVALAVKGRVKQLHELSSSLLTALRVAMVEGEVMGLCFGVVGCCQGTGQLEVCQVGSRMQRQKPVFGVMSRGNQHCVDHHLVAHSCRASPPPQKDVIQIGVCRAVCLCLCPKKPARNHLKTKLKVKLSQGSPCTRPSHQALHTADM